MRKKIATPSQTRRRRALALICLAMGLALLVGRGDGAPGKPTLSIPEPTHHAGTVDEGTSFSHTFTVRNQGTAELRILDVKPG